MVVGSLLGNLSVINKIKRPILKASMRPTGFASGGPAWRLSKKEGILAYSERLLSSFLDNRASNRLYASRHPGDSLHRV